MGEKIYQKLMEQFEESMKGGWWLPEKSSKLENGEVPRDLDSKTVTEEFMKPILVTGTVINDKQKQKFKDQNGDSYLLQFNDLETGEEMFTPINGNMKGLLTRLLLGINKDEQDQLKGKDQEQYQQLYERFNSETDLSDIPEEDRQVILKYCGKMSYTDDDGDEVKAHTWTGIRIKDIDGVPF